MNHKTWSREEQRVYMDGRRVVEGSTHGLQEPLLLVDGDRSNSPRHRNIEIESGHDGEGNSTNGNGDTMAETGRPKIPWGGEYAKSIVYGGLDAIVTCVSLVSSISAGHLSSVDVLVLGFANLVADGISIGFGDFLSSATERDLASNERHAAFWPQMLMAVALLMIFVNPYDANPVKAVIAALTGDTTTIASHRHDIVRA